MMYEFCDTNQTPGSAALPSEALCYDGVWIDNEISLFRTLYVSGRESFSADIAETALESMDGSVFLRRRLLPRTITVGYQMVASSAAALMTAYNHLNKVMAKTQVQVIFADEPDKYYVGTCRSIGAPEPGRLAVKAEMEIYCTDPCKYAVEEKTVYPNGSGNFVVECAGSYPVYPTFNATFSGNAKQVVFTDSAGASVAAGNPDADDPFFTSGDNLVIDCSAGKITLNDMDAPELGDIANRYEDMQLVPGSNAITSAYTGTAPTFRMMYREAWL